MSWREQIWEQKWFEALLPNYLKPLRDPQVETEFTKDMIEEAEEFLSDLASLSELPRINKTFKRNIKGFLFKVKIKPKKIHLELLDTKKSSDSVKKRIYITIFRKQFKAENGMGKCIDSTIYYQIKNKTTVRSVRRHPLFQTLFIQLHHLDVSLSGGKPEDIPTLTTKGSEKLANKNDEKNLIIQQASKISTHYHHMDSLISKRLKSLQGTISECLKEIELLDLEEKHHVKRLVNQDLPSLLETYHSLSFEQKKEKYEDVLNSLQSMQDFLDKLAKDVQSSRMDRMDHLLRLNRLRYSEDD
ncbi:hypothetical protein [Evansella tamaricis]|uniref:Uncharacterized protein n=1 Tax=Evansella tamaricis TaxID=2069301 RepID=A0ABS6JCD2_9BACI|nr:hypothetical protein [Evansella tamaricis]MBU9711325.1 hypothetical protein [Evansella tamaricis]